MENKIQVSKLKLYYTEHLALNKVSIDVAKYLVQNRSTYICNRRIPKVAKKKCRCLQQCRKTNAS